MQLAWGALLAGARLAPTVQQTAMDAGSQVSIVLQSRVLSTWLLCRGFNQTSEAAALTSRCSVTAGCASCLEQPSQAGNVPCKCVLQASWWYVVPADALELVRVSSLKTAKALQTVAKFCAQVCTDIARHR